MEIYPSNLTKLAKHYSVDRRTLKKLISEYGIKLSPSRRVITIRELELIFAALGKPPGFDKS